MKSSSTNKPVHSRRFAADSPQFTAKAFFEVAVDRRLGAADRNLLLKGFFLILRPKTFIAALGLSALFSLGLAAPVSANPYDDVNPDEPLYQRVKHLEVYGLLDPQDQKVLDEGKIVTRLELAFYTEKAKARITSPELLQPAATSTPVPTETPVPEVPAPAPALPPPQTAPAAPAPAPMPINAEARKEIDDLLKELKDEAALLMSRLNLYDERINEQEKELEALQDAQDEVNSIWKTANKSGGIPNFSGKTRFRFEDLGMSGVTVANFLKTENEMDFSMYSDLGGKGAIDIGLAGIYYGGNASDASSPVSFYIYNPDVTYNFDGPLGHWETHFDVEDYPGALTFGDFTRGIGPTALRLFQDPADIKHFSDDEDQKTWDDYMDNISAVPPTSAGGAIISSFDPVFDGVYGIGTNLPLLGSDARMIYLLGRMGTSNAPPQPDRFEEGLKISKPLGPVQADFSTEWINDDFGVNETPQLDLKTYQADFTANLSPVTLNAEVGLSSLLSGVYDIGAPGSPTGIPTNTALEAPAGQVELSYYPLNFFYTAISDGFADYSSKVAMSGVNFSQYGVYPGPSAVPNADLNMYGLVGEADTLESDRYGWRLNLGWDGRQQDWMKSWPSFLDDIVVNLNVASKSEYRAFDDAEGYNVVEAYNILQPFYQEDEGIWGLDLWGGYATPPWEPARQQYDNNIEDIRNDGDTLGDETRYQFTLSSEIIPIILPIYNNGGTLSLTPGAPGQAPATFSNGQNQYATLTDLKTYNYVTWTTKFQFNKILGIEQPLYGSVFYTDNVVSGTASNAATNLTGQASTSTNPSTFSTTIPNLFEQRVYDFTGMYQIFRHVDIMGEYGWETWNSSYTYPLVDYLTTVVGCGMSYDIPWGSGKFELRYKDVTFHDTYVPANSYHTGQWISELYFLF